MGKETAAIINQKLDAMYETIKTEFLSLAGEGQPFANYGVVDTKCYDTETSILVICKETNDLYPNETHGSFREWLKAIIEGKELLDGKHRGLWYQVGRWVKLSHDFLIGNNSDSYLSELAREISPPSCDLYQHIRYAAFTNVNKATGKEIAGVSYSKIAKASVTQEILKKEIEIIRPKVVLCCSTPVFHTVAVSLGFKEPAINTYGSSLITNDGTRYIHLCHPGAYISIKDKSDFLLTGLRTP